MARSGTVRTTQIAEPPAEPAAGGRPGRAGGSGERNLICPRCEAPGLTERIRDGVAIDVCDRCRGIWLDRGELERLLARAVWSGVGGSGGDEARRSLGGLELAPVAGRRRSRARLCLVRDLFK